MIVLKSAAEIEGRSFAEAAALLGSNDPVASVRRGLEIMDANQGEVWAKLDAGTEAYYRTVNRTHVRLDRILHNLTRAAIGHHEPKVVLLDEPTIGLDPHQIVGIRDLIRSLRGKMAVLISSHILHEVEQVCDKVVIINRGRVVAEDTPEELTRRLRGMVIHEKTPIVMVVSWNRHNTAPGAKVKSNRMPTNTRMSAIDTRIEMSPAAERSG